VNQEFYGDNSVENFSSVHEFLSFITVVIQPCRWTVPHFTSVHSEDGIAKVLRNVCIVPYHYKESRPRKWRRVLQVTWSRPPFSTFELTL